MAWISGERARYGTFTNLNLRANLTMGDLARHTSAGRIDVQSERAEVRDWIDKLGIVTRGPDAPITSLSGGNQQKVLVARALRLAPRVLVLDDPTAGIDVGAREQVHAIIETYTTESMSVLLVSTDSDELARLCDRVLVMVRGVRGRRAAPRHRPHRRRTSTTRKSQESPHEQTALTSTWGTVR